MGGVNITGPSTGTVVEDTVLVATGDFDNSGTPGGETWTISGQPTYGTVTINANGTWVYTIDMNDPAFAGLDTGDVWQDTFEVQLTRGRMVDTQTVTIDIQGLTDPCYAKGTLIETHGGKKLVENLQVGDLVRTLNNGFQSVTWVGGYATQATDKNAAVKIPKHAFGKGFPSEDLTVSPAHLVLLKNFHFEGMRAFEEVFIPAHFLTMPEAAHLFEVSVRPVRVEYKEQPIEYFHFVLPKHDIVVANKVWSESLNVGELSAETLTNKGGYNIKEIEELHSRLFAAAAPTLRKSEWLKICESVLGEALSDPMLFSY